MIVETQIDLKKLSEHPDCELLLQIVLLQNCLATSHDLFLGVTRHHSHNDRMNRNQLQVFRYIGSVLHGFVKLVPTINEAKIVKTCVESDSDSKSAFSRISHRLAEQDTDKCLVAIKRIHDFVESEEKSFKPLLTELIKRGVASGLVRMNNLDQTIDFVFANELVNDDFRLNMLSSELASFDTTLEEIVALSSQLRIDIDTVIARALLPLFTDMKTADRTSRMAELDVIYTLEAERYWEIKYLLGSDITLIQEMVDGYEFLLQQGQKLNVTSLSAEQMVLMQFLSGERAELSAGVLSLFRGHSSDSLSCTRRALEFALFSLNLFEREGAALAWLEANKSIEHYKNYREHFNIMEMLHLHLYENIDEYDRPIVEGIIRRYETCCTQVHATLLSMSESIEIRRKDDNNVDLVFHHVDRNHGLLTIRKLIWLLDTHLGILNISAKLFAKIVEEFDYNGWTSVISALTATHGKVKESWKKKFFPDGLPEAKTPVWHDDKDPKRKRKKIKTKHGSSGESTRNMTGEE